jgi:hypothetical protein
LAKRGFVTLVPSLSIFGICKLFYFSLDGSWLLKSQVPGLVNVDFADVRAIMKDAGSSLMGIGTATGKFEIFNFLLGLMRLPQKTPKFLSHLIRIIISCKKKTVLYLLRKKKERN